MLLVLFGLLASLSLAEVPYSDYILTPRSRTVYPVSVYIVNGTVDQAKALTSNGTATFQDQSAVTYDFGKNIGGIVSFDVVDATGEGQYIGISFTESSLWINSIGCDATADSGIDEALWFPVSSGGRYSADKKHQRGGFRYLNVYHNSTGSVGVRDLSILFTAIPQVADSNLGAYTGYFHSNDEQINRVWYAGAYTNELCTIDPTAGDALVHSSNLSSAANGPLAWYYNQTISNGSSVLVDGAKRDRLVWPGDMAIAVPSIAVSTFELQTIRDSLDSLLELQNKSTGGLPYAGRPFGSRFGTASYTYHLYSLIGVYDYYLFSGDLGYVRQNWETYKFALNFSLGYIDDTGLANVTQFPADWLRFGMGGHNIEANGILYNVLNQAVYLASEVNDTGVMKRYSSVAAKIKQAANDRLWDAQANLYRDNDTQPLTDLHPQDGNAWAILAGLTLSDEQNANISNALSGRWGKYGAPAPEAGATISPFISGFELQAHYAAGHPERAVRLMKFMWGDFMLDDPRMTNSTLIEGYSTNGDLHYAPYHFDPRISHAHGWATGPTSALTFNAAGLQIETAGGKTWKMMPSLGGLMEVRAGYSTQLGSFASNITATENGMHISFETPEGTTGTVSLQCPEKASKITISNTQRSGGDKAMNVPAGGKGRLEIGGLPGGRYNVTLVAA